MFKDTISLTVFALSFDQGQVHNTQVRALRRSDGTVLVSNLDFTKALTLLPTHPGQRTTPNGR
jgi:hypothetical protein